MTESRGWFILSVFAAVGGLLYLLAPVLTPFLVSGLVAYMGAPAVDVLERWRVPRTLAVIIVFALVYLVVLLLLLVLVPLLERQIAMFVVKLPAYIDWLQQVGFPWLQRHFGLEGYSLDLEGLKRVLEEQSLREGAWQKLGGMVASVASIVSRSGAAIFGWLVSALVVLVVTFYLLRDWHALLARLRALLPPTLAPTAERLARDCDEVLGAFVRGQLTVMVALGAFYSIGLWLVGLELALLIGILAGLVSFVPYLGVITGVLAAGIAAVVQFQDILHLLPVLLVFGLGQLLEGFVLTPMLVGDRLGLHPVAVIFSVMAGGQLFGFFGILLALPVAAVAVVLLRHFYTVYRQGEAPPSAPRSVP